MDRVNELIRKYDWYLQSWSYRYGGSTLVIVSPHAGYLDSIRDIADGSDIESLDLVSYFNNEGSWLPVAFGETLFDSLVKLNEKLMKIENNEKWRTEVYDAFEKICEVSDGSYGLSDAVENDKDSVFVKIKEI